MKRAGHGPTCLKRKKKYLDLLSNSMALDSKKMGEGGWVSRDELIRNDIAGPNPTVTEDIWRSLWYYLKKMSKTLEKCLQIPGGLKPIENRKAGREKSFWRLNPEVFQLAKPEDDKGAG